MNDGVMSAGSAAGGRASGGGMMWRWRRNAADERSCLCGGIGYLMRVTDRAMVKCPWCDGTGVRKAVPA